MRPTFDQYGDISDETAKYIGDAATWLDFCANCWATTMGSIVYFEDNGVDYVRFITGGWSANESVIYEMKQNYVMWGLCWSMSQRGGLHEFEVRG